jgi:hypothetical protein
MKNIFKQNSIKVVVLVILVVVGVSIYFSQRGGHNNISDSFACPESYTSPQDQTNAVAKFISEYSKVFPNATVADMYTYRYHLLVSHSCNKTLANMLQNVTTLDQMLRLEAKDFGPQKIEFTKDTGVLSSYFTLDGQGLENPDEELIFNFYLQNVWTNGAISTEYVAQVVADSYGQSDTSQVIYKFTAPDTITKNPDFFIFSDVTYPDQGYGYLYVTKISSLQNSVFSITYSRKFTASATKLQSNINDWLAQDLKLADGYSKEIDNIGVDSSWLTYLSNSTNTPAVVPSSSSSTGYDWIGWLWFLPIILGIIIRARRNQNKVKSSKNNNHTHSGQRHSNTNQGHTHTEAHTKERRPQNDPEMRDLYLKVIHKYHPDFARGDEDKKFRTELTAKLNRAYQEGDIATLKLFQ